MDVGNPSIVMDSSICEASEGVEKVIHYLFRQSVNPLSVVKFLLILFLIPYFQVTPVKEQSSLNDPDCAEKVIT